MPLEPNGKSCMNIFFFFWFFSFILWMSNENPNVCIKFDSKLLILCKRTAPTNTRICQRNTQRHEKRMLLTVLLICKCVRRHFNWTLGHTFSCCYHRRRSRRCCCRSRRHHHHHRLFLPLIFGGYHTDDYYYYSYIRTSSTCPPNNSQIFCAKKKHRTMRRKKTQRIHIVIWISTRAWIMQNIHNLTISFLVLWHCHNSLRHFE